MSVCTCTIFIIRFLHMLQLIRDSNIIGRISIEEGKKSVLSYQEPLYENLS